MSQRITIEVRWSKPDKAWQIKRRGGAVMASAPTKEAAVRRGALEARLLWLRGYVLELVIYRKDGAISKGKGGRRTYGDDPRRSKG